MQEKEKEKALEICRSTLYRLCQKKEKMIYLFSPRFIFIETNIKSKWKLTKQKQHFRRKKNEVETSYKEKFFFLMINSIFFFAQLFVC